MAMRPLDAVMSVSDDRVSCWVNFSPHVDSYALVMRAPDLEWTEHPVTLTRTEARRAGGHLQRLEVVTAQVHHLSGATACCQSMCRSSLRRGEPKHVCHRFRRALRSSVLMGSSSVVDVVVRRIATWQRTLGTQRLAVRSSTCSASVAN
jgi:hypothetical protein